jgi:hypothetical protein
MEHKFIVMSVRTIAARPTSFKAFITKKKNSIIEACAFSLIFLFVYAATSKLFRWHLFRFQLEGYPWIRHFAGWVVWMVPLLELVIVAALLIPGRTKLLGFYLSTVLLIIFTVYLLAMLGTRQHLPCSCGGVIQGLTWGQHIVFNLFFIFFSIIGAFCQRLQLRESIFFHHLK